MYSTLTLRRLSMRFLEDCYKVQAQGVCGKVYSWIENWLMDSKQRVKINSSYSGLELGNTRLNDGLDGLIRLTVSLT